MTTAADDRMTEDAFEAILVGRPTPGGAAGLAAFTEAVRSSATSPGRPNAALAELLATGLLADQSSPSTRTVTTAGTSPSSRPRVRIRRRFAMLFPALLAKILSAGAVAQAATGATVVVVAFAGAGAAGVLPGPVQDTFTSIVSNETEELPVEEVPVEEGSEDEVLVEEVPVEEPLEEVPVEDPADVDAQVWLDAGPEGYGSFGAWVSAGASDPDLKDDLRAQGLTFGSVVSQWARNKGMSSEDLAEEGVDPEVLDDDVTEDGAVVEDAPEADAPEGEVAGTEQPTQERGNRGNGNSAGSDDGDGGGRGNGNGNGNGRN